MRSTVRGGGGRHAPATLGSKHALGRACTGTHALRCTGAPDGHGRSMRIEKLGAWTPPAGGGVTWTADMAPPGMPRRVSSTVSRASDMAACAPSCQLPLPASSHVLLSTSRLARPGLVMS